MDQHVRRGLLDTDKIPSQILNFNGCYTIPWRCYYAKDLENVMLAGRDISTTKWHLDRRELWEPVQWVARR